MTAANGSNVICAETICAYCRAPVIDHRGDTARLCLQRLSTSAATPIDVTQPHDFVLLKDDDHCGLRGCTLGVLEHRAIPAWETVAAAEATCTHCHRRECECSEFDVSPDIGARG